MANEHEKKIVDHLVKYFSDRSRCRGSWKLVHRAKSKSQTGWDLQIERNKLALLIEAKHIRGNFAASMAGLVISPLSKRAEKTKNGALICWAVGSSYGASGDCYSNFFDYFARNPKFWEHYSRLLGVKYIYFVKRNRQVARARLTDIVKLLHKRQYNYDPNAKIRVKRSLAEKIVNKHLAFR